MAGGQQEILGRHIYECDIQNTNGIIIPTDGKKRKNLQVFIKNGNTEIASGYTDKNGVFDINYFLSATGGSYNLITKCGNVIASIDTSGNSLNVLQCSLILESDKNVISYIDEESAIISATLKGTYTNELLSDREITFEVKKNNDIISRETVKTNSSGVAEITYNSKGLGDVSVAAYIGMLSTEIYVEDLIQFIPSATSNGFKTTYFKHPVQITGQTRAKGTWGGTRIYGADTDGGGSTMNYIFLSNNSSNTSEEEKIRYNLSSTLVDFKAIIQNGTVSLYINDNLVKSVSTEFKEYVYVNGGSNANQVTVSNLKIKPL